MKILIVDDNDIVRWTLSLFLTLSGWQTFPHDQYADCSSLIREHGIDVIITDFSMPAITGLDLIEKLRADGIRIPALILSADTHAIDRDRAERLDVFRIISKPPNGKELRNALTEAVANDCE